MRKWEWGLRLVGGVDAYGITRKVDGVYSDVVAATVYLVNSLTG